MFFDVFFWGCPALQAGRAVSQLAIRSALRKKARRAFLLGLPPAAALLSIPQPRALRALLDQNALTELELPKNTTFY